MLFRMTVVLDQRIRRAFSFLLIVLFAGMVSGQAVAQIKIMPLGDSITHGSKGSVPGYGGYRDDLADMLVNEGMNFDFVGTQTDYYSTFPYHEGHPSFSVQMILNKVESYLNSSHPDMVLLHIGTNDINEDQSTSYVKMRTSSLLDAIWAFNPDITVILSSIVPRLDETKNEDHAALAPLIESLVEEKEDAGYSVYYCPMYEFFTNYSNWRGWIFDDMHPNNDGYNAMARAWYKQITDILTAEGKVIADNFNRKSLVGYWTSNASYGLNGYQMENQTENSDGNIAVFKYQTDPKSVSFSYGNNTIPGGEGRAGLALRLSEGSKNASGYAVVKDAITGDLVLSLIEQGQLGAEIDRITGLYDTPIAGDTLRVAMYSDLSAHYFECYLNGRFEGRLIDVGRQQGNNGDQHAGLLLMGSENNRVDNFTYSWDDVVPYEGPSRLEMVSGDLNSGIVAHAASQPLVVRVEDFSGSPAVGFPVTFTTNPSGIVWTEGGSDLAAYEIEQARFSENSHIENVDSASAGAFIKVDQTSGAAIELRFEAPETGAYQFWVRTLNSTGTTGSFQVRIDDASEFSWLVDPAEGWTWQPVSADGAVAAGTFDLSEGLHLLHISGGFVDAGLDRIILSRDPGFSPQATRDGSSLFYSESSGEVTGHLIFAEQTGAVEITAFLPDYTLPDVRFSATAEADVPELMRMIAGNNQVGKPTEVLPLPLQVKITDQFENPVPDIAVRYETTLGDATFEEAQPVMTDENGIAETQVRLGVEAGNQSFQAQCEDFDLDPVLFAAIAQKTLFSISGQMIYWANGQPIPYVRVVTSGDISASDTTTVDGVYAFRTIPKHTDFSIAPEKELSETEAHVTVDLYNAAFVMRAVLGLEELNAYQQMAADVDQNYQVESYDAANIARFVVELPPVSSQIRVGEWTFTPGNQSYSNITVDLANKNFTGIIIGDVVGRYETNYSLMKSEEYGEYQWSGDFSAAVGDTITIPFNVDRDGIMSCDLYVNFEPDNVEFIECEKTSLSRQFTVFKNNQRDRVQIAAFSPYPTENTGDFLALHFRVLAETVNENSIVFEKYRFNTDPYIVVSTGVPLNPAHELPMSFELSQNYPNPFSVSRHTAGTRISYALPKESQVEITIYNMLGQRVKTLVQDFMPAGSHEITWDAMDVLGQPVATGVYLYHLRTPNDIVTRRMLIIK